MDDFIFQLVFIANDIYNSLGQGYNEIIYHRAFEVALRLSNINYESEVITPIFYKNFNYLKNFLNLLLFVPNL